MLERWSGIADSSETEMSSDGAECDVKMAAPSVIRDMRDDDLQAARQPHIPPRQ